MKIRLARGPKNRDLRHRQLVYVHNMQEAINASGAKMYDEDENKFWARLFELDWPKV